MSDVVLVPFRGCDLSTLESWFQEAETRRRVGGMEPLRRWFEHVQAEPGRFSWLAREDDRPVGLVDLEIYPDRTASVAVLVGPEVRNRGHGKRILRTLLKQPELIGVKTIAALVEPNNEAALRCLRSVGFTLRSDEPDRDGFLSVVYTFP